MNILEKRSKLVQRQASLNKEIVKIEDEIRILHCLQNKAAEEISKIQAELEQIEDNKIITLNCANV